MTKKKKEKKEKKKLTDTFTVAELNTVTASMRDVIKNEIKGIEKVKLIDSNDIKELSDRLTKLTLVRDILGLFDGMVTEIGKGLGKLRAEETK